MSDRKQPQNLTKRQKEKLAKYMADDRVLMNAVAGTVSKKKKSPRARAVARGDAIVIRNIVADMLRRLPPDRQEEIRRVVCQQHDYCRNRKDYQFVATIIQIVMACINIKAGALCVVAFAIKFRVLDEICDCKNKTQIRMPKLPKTGNLTNDDEASSEEAAE